MGARRYTDEPVPSVLRGTSDDNLRAPGHVDSTSTTGSGPNGIPIPSQPDHRAPLGTGLTVAHQSPMMGAEVKMSGAGRAFIPPTLSLPVQSPTPEPDRRRIARPMPTQARDQVEVIRPQTGGR